jgi:hypothetical protein
VEAAEYTGILKRVGTVLVVVGLLDVGVMVYCILNKVPYGSSFNIFAVIAGVLLIRGGGLRTASNIRLFSAFLPASFVTVLVAWPFMQPLDVPVEWEE